MKNKFSLTVSAVLLAVLLAVCGTSVYAWLCVSDNASQMKFQLARINSVVYFYTARDFDLNGIPDLITDSYKPAENANEAHDPYYKETRYFDYVDKKEAVAEGTSGDIAAPVSITDFTIDVAPTKVYTMKLSLVNKSDSANDVSLILPSTVLSGAQAKIYSTLKVRVCRIESDGNDGNAASTVKVGDWHYLCNKAAAGGDNTQFGETKVAGEFPLKGMDEQLKDENKDKVVNTADLWLQVSMATYKELSALETFTALGISQADYQALQGVDEAFTLAFTVLFQIDIDNTTGN